MIELFEIITTIWLFWFYMGLRRLKLLRYMLTWNIMMFLLKLAMHFYPSVSFIRIFIFQNAFVFALEMVLIIAGVIYHIGYLGVKLETQAQFDSLFGIPISAIIPPNIQPNSLQKIHYDFWQHYHSLK